MLQSPTRRAVFAVAIIACASLGNAARTPLAAQSSLSLSDPPLELTRLTGTVTVDGVPDEPVWKDIPALPLTLYQPVFRGTPTQRTEIRVAYDDEYFYAAGWFHDTDPSGIRVNSLYRDRWNGDDAFAIYIDAFNDNRNAKWFGLTASGVRFDQLVSDDGATLNGSWDTFWAARTTITGEGWFAEVRIPFSSIGFRADADGKAIMGLTVTRLVSRLEERVTFPEIDPKFEFRRPSVARDIVLRDVRTRKPLYVTPYALTGRSRTAIAPTGDATRFTTDRNRSNEVGLDVRYPLSGNLTLDVTINTDFAQVEADDQQVNLDRFPLFFPERRRFFQEGSGIFDFVAGGGARLFNSRRIGLASGVGTIAEPVPIYGGARLVGRVGAWDVGLLEMQTQKHGVTPSENFGVLRLRRPVLNPYSTAGFMVTSYHGAGRHNLGLGTDASVRVFGDHYATLKYSATVDSEDSSDVTFGSRSLFDFRWERRTQRGLSYNINSTHMGRDYLPEVGFLQRTNFTTANVSGNWYIYTDKHRWLRRYYPGWLAFHTWRHSDDQLESGMWAVWVQWDTKAGGGGWLEPKWFHENVARPFTIGDATIPVGQYDFFDFQVNLSMGPGKKLRSGVDFRTGTFYDGTRTQVILTPTWNVSPHLELGADYQLSHLEFDRRDQVENVQVSRLRVRTALDARASGNAFIQYNSTTDRLDFNVRLRYAFAEGTDLWLVYNEGLDTRSADFAGVEPPTSLARTVILKYTHTLGF
ncbi:MAG TPA: DUF5916 domain-containing protein [Gemmatimonadaceae bacterium]|nr:DUF5916 domain-containing protein [Gemmatimonadaceae bacterium]